MEQKSSCVIDGLINSVHSTLAKTQALSRPTLLVMHAAKEKTDTRKQPCLRPKENSTSSCQQQRTDACGGNVLCTRHAAMLYAFL